MSYDFLVVGTGFYGATFANIATKKGKKVLMVESRPQCGGNSSTEKIAGINVHSHGPHIFRTNNESIKDFVTSFAKFIEFEHRMKVSHQGRLYSFPINLMTMNQLWGVNTPEEAVKKLESVRMKIENPQNMEEYCLSLIGEELYELFIKGYTTKQWGKPPKELPTSIIKRIPIRYNLNDHYFLDKNILEGVPVGGYTELIQKMIGDIEVKYNVDFLKHKKELANVADKIVYTGCIDEYFDYKLGRLEYRSLRFEHEIHDGDYQGCSIINYTDQATPYTRIVEHKHFERLESPKTVITKEYPMDFVPGATPYYPVNDQKNNDLYRRYTELAEIETNIHFGGRLGAYRYYDMDHAIGAAMAFVKKVM